MYTLSVTTQTRNSPPTWSVQHVATQLTLPADSVRTLAHLPPLPLWQLLPLCVCAQGDRERQRWSDNTTLTVTLYMSSHTLLMFSCTRARWEGSWDSRGEEWQHERHTPTTTQSRLNVPYHAYSTLTILFPSQPHCFSCRKRNKRTWVLPPPYPPPHFTPEWEDT